MNPALGLEQALKLQRESLDKQRVAIRRQLAGKTEAQSDPVAQFLDPLPALSQAACPPLDDDKVGNLVNAAAQQQSLDPALLRAVMRQESAFKPCAVSFKGAQGLMQLMPATARELHVADSFDPAQNVGAGAAYLKQLLNRYNGDLRLALVGYNAGPGRADQPLGAPYPLETQNYVASILAELGIGTADQTPLDEADQSAEDDEEVMPAAPPAVNPAANPAPLASTKPQSP
jgi:hypothetical protein